MASTTPIPTKLKILRGNPGKRRLNPNEPSPVLLEEPSQPPEFLNERGAREWQRVSMELIRLRMLTSLDLAALGVYCGAYQLHYEAAEQLKSQPMRLETPHGVIPNPLIKIREDAGRQMRSFGAEFGMTPSSRTRIKVPDAAPATDPYTEWKNRRR